MYRFLLGSWSRTGVSNEILMALGLLKPNDSKSLTSMLTHSMEMGVPKTSSTIGLLRDMSSLTVVASSVMIDAENL